MKQTAVEWLFEVMFDSTWNKEHQMKWLEKAKALEKEQIMDAIKFTVQDEFTKQTWKNGKCSHDTALNYYNNKFKINKNEKDNNTDNNNNSRLHL
jgi:hypothetical protein